MYIQLGIFEIKFRPVSDFNSREDKTIHGYPLIKLVQSSIHLIFFLDLFVSLVKISRLYNFRVICLLYAYYFTLNLSLHRVPMYNILNEWFREWNKRLCAQLSWFISLLPRNIWYRPLTFWILEPWILLLFPRPSPLTLTRWFFRGYPANMRRWPIVGLLLDQRRRRWADNKPTVGQRLMFAWYISVHFLNPSKAIHNKTT